MGFAFLGVASIITGAIGAGVSYASASSAADTQNQLATLNAQATLQSVEQSGQVNRMQASINGQLAKADQDAANANADALGQDAEAKSSASRNAIRQAREDARRFLGAQRAAIAVGNFVDTTGSPYMLAFDTEFKDQQNAERMAYENEDERRALFREGSAQRTQGQLAGLNVTGQRVQGIAAAQRALAEASQAKLTMYSERAAASAARTKAAGGLFTQFGGLAGSGYTMLKNG